MMMDIEHMALLIPIFGIVLGVAIAIVAIVTSHREKLKRAEQRHIQRLAAIEKGIELPFDPEPEADTGRGSTLRALREIAGPDIALFGLVPAAIGVAGLISYFVAQRKAGSNDAPK
jgi:hypothetical protein